MKKIGIVILIAALIIAAVVMFLPKEGQEKTTTTTATGPNGFGGSNIGGGVGVCPQVVPQHQGFTQDKKEWFGDASRALTTIGYTIEQVNANDHQRINQIVTFAKGHNIKLKGTILQFYKNEILQYIGAGGSQAHWDVAVGDFVCSSDATLLP